MLRKETLIGLPFVLFVIAILGYIINKGWFLEAYVSVVALLAVVILVVLCFLLSTLTGSVIIDLIIGFMGDK